MKKLHLYVAKLGFTTEHSFMFARFWVSKTHVFACVSCFCSWNPKKMLPTSPLTKYLQANSTDNPEVFFQKVFQKFFPEAFSCFCCSFSELFRRLQNLSLDFTIISNHKVTCAAEVCDAKLRNKWLSLIC